MNAYEALGVLKAAFRIPDLEHETVRLYVKSLSELEEILDRVVKAAVDRCKFFPTIAELREIAAEVSGGQDGHLGPEEAWALVAGLTEDDSVIWTDAIAVAYGIARSVLPDRVGARMAFLAAYRRELATAPSHPRWWASLGENVAGRAAAVSDAMDQGRLPENSAQKMLPPQYWPSEHKALPDAASPSHED